MSKAYSTRSSTVNTRGRGASTRGRGRDLSSVQTTPQASAPNTRSRSRQNPSTSTRTSPNVGKGKMYGRGINHADSDINQNQGLHGRLHEPSADSSQGSTQQGQYAGGYTVFQPNVRKRQQINERAQRETAAYEEYKQKMKPKNVNYVGTAGGDVTEETVRNRQHHDNRFQKLKRQQQQEGWRLAKKEQEQREIDAKRKEARRKAEQNELGGQVADPEDLRRRREAFLRRLENHDME